MLDETEKFLYILATKDDVFQEHVKQKKYFMEKEWMGWAASPSSTDAIQNVQEQLKMLQN